MSRRFPWTEDTKRKRLPKWLEFCLVVGFLVLLVAGYRFITSGPAVEISDGMINIHLHSRHYFSARNYEVLIDDIANIELLPYSARQLSDRIDDLSVPRYQYVRPCRDATRITTRAGYTSNGNYRLHVSLHSDAAPTIWITRYEGVPVLLSFRYGDSTIRLYERLVEAWRE